MTSSASILILFILLSCSMTSVANAGISCERKFDGLEELRISSFESVVESNTQAACTKAAEKFLTDVGSLPKRCNLGIQTVIKEWSDAYQSDTQKTLSSDPQIAYATLKDWAYQTLKTKCEKRQFD